MTPAFRKSRLDVAMQNPSEAAVLARHANARVTAAMYAGVTDSARETLADRLAAAGYGS